MGKKMKISCLFVSLSFLIFMHSGCGSIFGGGEDDYEGPAPLTEEQTTAANALGFTECFNCHSDAGSPPGVDKVFGDSYSSQSAKEGWLSGPHANYETVDQNHQHIDLGADNVGFPDYGYFSDDTCKTCHDQLGDGQQLSAYYSKTGISAIGKVNRPVIGCESCHGSGKEHLGGGDLPSSNPDAGKCGQCHGDAFPDNHLAYHPEGDKIYENYLASPHAKSATTAGTTAVACSGCHTDEGAKGEIGDSAVQCRTCHDSHNPDNLLKPGTTGFSAEYNTCTNCHQASGGYHTEGSKSISDTHFDSSLTGNIEGYVVDNSSDRSCSDCHNPHKADNTINGQWAHSAHGGHILETIDATTDIANVTDATGPAWAHYDFKGASRQSCQRCHTSTGFKNFASNPLAYAAANNVFFATGSQKEMLYCWACHKNNAGGLRDPGVFVNAAPYKSPAGRIANVPDVAGSNICLACHSGRETGGTLNAKTDASFTNASFLNPHYLAAGGTLFRTTGYEYGALVYDDSTAYVHNKIGTGAVPGGTNGPCAGCHMKGAEGHTFTVVTNTAGPIDDIASFDSTCSKCHFSGKASLISSLDSNHAGYLAALDALKSLLLSQKGYSFYPAHPYFYNAAGYDAAYTETGSCSKNLAVKNWLTGGSNNYIYNGTSCVLDYQNDGTAGTGKANMGAAFNYSLLHHEPGAYVHNLIYTKRLIYDSIDYIDDGSMNQSVKATLDGLGYTTASGFLGSSRP